MKIGILGAGISGLSIGRMLCKYFDVEVLEKNSCQGGIARTRDIDGISYHQIGGHCFNSKFPEVLDFVFNEVLPEEEWNKIRRVAKIRFKGNEIAYPIEYSTREIAKFDMPLVIDIVNDFMQKDERVINNLEDWFRSNFGDTLAEEYFIPYNAKIWNILPSQMNPSWVIDKLPIPNKESFLRSIFSDVSDSMPHSTFYYPKTNNQNTFIEKLSTGVPIVYGYNVENLKFDDIISQWIVNDEKKYDLIINTTPLNCFIQSTLECDDYYKNLANYLRYNRVTTMLWESGHTDSTWTYIPDAGTIFHRYIHIGNFFRPIKNVTIVESVGERSYEEMVSFGSKDPFLKKPLSYNVSDHAYVVFDNKSIDAKKIIIKYLDDLNLFSLGRFGEWEYYNMDVCIKHALNLSEKIKNMYNEKKF